MWKDLKHIIMDTVLSSSEDLTFTWDLDRKWVTSEPTRYSNCCMRQTEESHISLRVSCNPMPSPGNRSTCCLEVHIYLLSYIQCPYRLRWISEITSLEECHRYRGWV